MLIEMCEAGLIPDALLRRGVRHITGARLAEEGAADPAGIAARKAELLASWQAGPIAVQTRQANEQHYELPPAFFELVLGAHLKYSCGLWPAADMSLDESEAAMLALSCARAQIEDGMAVLDLGCGWGSMSLWLAERYPASRILAVSNSTLQRDFILQQARDRRLENLEVQTCDINRFEPSGAFDRIVSIEMMEHVRNHRLLFERIGDWLRPGGKLFSHVFCHRELLYPYENRGAADWMSRHFFSGGVMPSFDLFLHCQQSLLVEQRWWLPGTHYAATSNAWLARLDSNRRQAREILEQHYPPGEARRWLHRWRMFFIAVAEFFDYEQGRQWGVGHYLLSRR